MTETYSATELEFLHTMVDQLRDQRDNPPLIPTADIDMVWCVSAPGTIKSNPIGNNSYEGKSYDKIVIDHSIDVLRNVTASRLGQDPASVQKENIATHGPIFYYNGEHEGIPTHVYRQNEDLLEAAEDPAFPVPLSKLVIGKIDQAHTPAQVKELASYLGQASDVEKIAVVSLGGHSVRVNRYLERHKRLFEPRIKFLRAPASLTHDSFGTVCLELKKALAYRRAGHLATHSYFHNPANQ